MKQPKFILHVFNTLQEYVKQAPSYTAIYATFEDARKAGNNEECVTFDIVIG